MGKWEGYERKNAHLVGTFVLGSLNLFPKYIIKTVYTIMTMNITTATAILTVSQLLVKDACVNCNNAIKTA